MTRFGVLGVPENTGRAQTLATTWTNAFGERIEIRSMTDSHLENALAMIVGMERRKEGVADVFNEQAMRVLAGRDPRGPGLLSEWKRRFGRPYPQRMETPLPTDWMTGVRGKVRT